ncbi:sigma-70 family RNA polymerase sigma factor [Paenibacillus chitinolyticus]|uniref:sigma-70 family RNA polymerase sigma factor n=1 Tax=Paenibacillus chitinolyticus TaxID=79263 RepID=UPI002DBDC68C|nr:sigma-70 family RNA polymerase sigma factor [Paenibacillus chitinolyticus]MEC0244301.1 sigma-70 family RNA polymerase sigma factor [Paenibacillus chitinolyticus]
MELTKFAVEAIAGDREAFVSLVRHSEDSLHHMAKSILGKDEDVADALQETVLKAYKAIPSLREPKFFKTWMFRILINECHTILANRSRAVAYSEVPAASSFSDDYDKVDMREAVDRLDENQRIVVILHYFEDLPLRQVANALNISESAVKMRLSRARDTLLKHFKILREGKMNYGSI